MTAIGDMNQPAEQPKRQTPRASEENRKRGPDLDWLYRLWPSAWVWWENLAWRKGPGVHTCVRVLAPDTRIEVYPWEYVVADARSKQAKTAARHWSYRWLWRWVSRRWMFWPDIAAGPFRVLYEAVARPPSWAKNDRKFNRWRRVRMEYWDWRADVDHGLVDWWYWPIRNFVRPHNRLKLRNCPRSWTDRDWRIKHAVFSVVCDFVELEVGGRAKLLKQIVERDEYWATERDREAKLKAEGKTPGVDYGGPGEAHAKAWLNASRDILVVYDWYTGVDWDEPAGVRWGDDPHAVVSAKEDAFREKEDEMLAKAIAVRGFMWI